MNKNKITIVGVGVLLSLGMVSAQDMMASSTRPMPKIIPMQIPMILVDGVTGDTLIDAKIALLRKEYRDKMKLLTDDYQAKVKAVAGDLKFKNKEMNMMMGKKDEVNENATTTNPGIRGSNRGGPDVNKMRRPGDMQEVEESMQNNMGTGMPPKKQRSPERIPVKLNRDSGSEGSIVSSIGSWFGGGN